MSKTYEIERKFLLTKVPANLPTIKTITYISDYYQNPQARLRCQIISGDVSYVYVDKQRTGEGLKVREETQEVLEDKDRINSLIENAVGHIVKRRYTVDYKGKEWEIDEYTNLSLVVAEVEELSDSPDSTEIDDTQLPPFISDHLIFEVTDMEHFYNYNLSQLI